VQFEGAMPSDLKISIEKLEARTKAGRLRGLMPMIEAKIRQGIRHVDVIRALNDQGFAISEYTYRSYLQRYRKRQAAKKALLAEIPSSAPPVAGVARKPPTFDYDPRGIPDLLK